MSDQAIELPVNRPSSCPHCDGALSFAGPTLLVGHGGGADRFECDGCGFTRLRPRRKIGRSYFEMLSAAMPPRPRRTAMIRPAPAFALAQA